MKKFLTLALLCLFTIVTYGATSGSVGDIAYSFNDDGTATISGFAYGVSGITELEIPATVTYQGDDYTVTKISHDLCNAPNYYSAILTYVSIPSTVVEIGYRAFNGQTSLTTIYCYPEEVPALTSSNGVENVFNNVTATVYVPAASLEAYQEAWGATYTGLTFVAIGDEGTTEPVMTVTPSNGEVLTEALSEILVSCEDGIAWNTNVDLYFQVKNSAGDVVAGAWKANMKEESGDKVVVYSLPLYDDAITTSDVPVTLDTNGEYTFTIPEGAFFLGSDQQKSDEVNVTFSLELASKEYVITFYPENGGEMTIPEGGLTEVVISCEDGISAGSYGSYSWRVGGDAGSVSVTKATPADDGKSFTLSLSSPLTTAGTYSLQYSSRGSWVGTLPEGLFLLGPDKVESEEMEYSFTLVEAGDTGGTEGGTADDPYTVSEAIEVISALESGGNIDGIYVKGIVSQIGTFSSSYGDLIYYISDDGTTNNQLEIYYGYYLNNEKFTSADQIKVGDKVVVTGTFTNYNGNTPEGAMGATWIYSLEEGEGGDEGGDSNITRTNTTLTITNPNVEEGTETVSVDISSLGYENGDDVTSITVDEYTTMTIAQGDGYNAPKYYTTDTSLRIYADNTITFSSTREIAKVVFNCASGYTGNTTATVEFDGNEILFCNLWTSTSGGTQLRIQSVDIVYTTAEEEDDSIYFVEPENGSSVTSLESFNIIWNDKGEYNENNNGVTWNYLSTGASWEADVYDDNDNVVTTLFMESYIYPDGKTFMDGVEAIGLQFGYYNFITTPGKYTVTIPGGLIGFGETSHGSLGRYYEDIVVTYTVVSAGYSISPASGTDVTELTTVTITADDGEITLLDEDADIVVTNREGTEITTATASIEDGVLVITLVDEITNPQLAGEYHIAIPGGLFSCNDAENEELNLIYYVNPDVEYSLNPEDGADVKSLTTITVGYHDGVCVASGVQLSSMQILDTAGDVVTSVASYDTLEETYNGSDYPTIYAVVLNLADSITTEGTYTLNIPRNTLQFYVGMADDDDEGISGGGVTDGWIDNNPITATYTVSSDAVDPADYVLSFDPANGEEVESLDEMKILCDKGIYANVDDTFNVTDTNGTIVSVLSIGEAIYEVEGDESSLVVGYNCSFSPVVTDPGTYSVSFVRGAFLLGSDYSISSAQTALSYTVAGEKEAGTSSTGTSDGFTYTVTPGEGEVESLSSIYIGCETGVYDEDMSTASDIKVYKDGDSEPVTSALRVIADQGDDYDIGFTIVLSNKLIDEGDYKVVIPAGFFSWLVDGTENDVLCSEITLNYIISENGGDTGDSGDTGNDELYKKLCEEIAETNSYLDDTWSTIVSDYPDAANTLLDRYNDLVQEIADLQSAVDTQYEEGQLEEEVDADEAKIAAIREAIAQLLADVQGDTTGLYKIGMDYSKMNVYTLGGQKINAPTMRGVYIIDGKKVLVK